MAVAAWNGGFCRLKKVVVVVTSWKRIREGWRKVAEMHLPSLESKEGTWLHVDDMDLFQVWSLKFSTTIRSHAEDFVSTYGLAVDDYIMVYKDDDNGSYAVRAKKLSRAPRVSVNEYYGNYYSMEMEATAPYYGQDQLPAGDMGMTSSSMNLGLLSHQFPSSDEFHDDEYVNVVNISPFANHH
ncbi:B3 domain-containing transcription factor FUS3-like [Humulus lupulus]|uniref:B3 domain-containing transcription factor FUS3-like n=1 Tax=Humulus lupulus TaxID=3486 RepID=UPI002B411445|nr:B3 domain-containing transcription factor FUS3-like [Humulus lupulus]